MLIHVPMHGKSVGRVSEIKEEGALLTAIVNYCDGSGTRLVTLRRQNAKPDFCEVLANPPDTSRRMLREVTQRARQHSTKRLNIPHLGRDRGVRHEIAVKRT